MSFTVKNVGTKTIDILSPGGPPLQFQALLGSQEVWLSSRAGGAGFETFSLAPNTSKVFNTIWSQRTPTDIIGNPSVSAGKYTISAWLDPASLDGKEFSPEQEKTDLSANSIEISIRTP